MMTSSTRNLAAPLISTPLLCLCLPVPYPQTFPGRRVHHLGLPLSLNRSPIDCASSPSLPHLDDRYPAHPLHSEIHRSHWRLSGHHSSSTSTASSFLLSWDLEQVGEVSQYLSDQV